MGGVADKVAIYCRLSMEDSDKPQEEDSESIQNQKLLLMDYCMNNGFSIHKVYSDDDYSGLDRDRPQFNQMLKDAEAGLFNIVLCKTQSRFTRDMELVEKYIHGQFLHWGIRFISVIDNIDTAVKGNKKSRQINALINEWYCEDLSENIRAVFKKKMQDGQFLGAFAPYGYMKSSEDNHKLIIDEEAANVVREIFNLYLQGYGTLQISNILTKRGIPTPTIYKKQKGYNFSQPNDDGYSGKYGIWAVNTVAKILRNETYVGHLIQAQAKKVSYKSKKVIPTPKEDWIIVKNNHDPIIAEGTFKAVKELRSHRRSVCKPVDGYKGVKSAHVFAGKIFCLDCGTSLQLSGSYNNGETRYLRCGFAAKTKGKGCTSHCITLNKVADIVEHKIKQLINTYVSCGKNVAAVMEMVGASMLPADTLDTKIKDLKSTEAKIQEIMRFSATAYGDKVKGIITDEEFFVYKSLYADDLEIQQYRKKMLEDEIKKQKEAKNPLESIDSLMQKHLNFDKLTNEIVNHFIDSVHIGEKDRDKNQEIVINWAI